MWTRRNQKINNSAKETNQYGQKQVMIPLMDMGPVSIQQKMNAFDRNISNPKKQKLQKIKDRSYIIKKKKATPLEKFCDSFDKIYSPISPDGHFFLIWNVLLIASILYNFFELPISIFLTQRVYNDQFNSPVWITINVIMLVIIFADMAFVRWNLAYYQYGELITRRYSIVKNYLKFQIYLDMISFIVFLSYISTNYRPLVYLKLFFYLKVYSLFKVDKSLINYLQIHKVLYLIYIFFRIIFILFFIVIWIAAVYFAIDYSYYLEQGSYYQNSQLWLIDTLSGVDFIQDLNWPYWLLYAAYWASEISATIGYGVGTPRNPVTVAYCCFVIVLMTVVFALFINTIWGIISQIQQSSTQYYENWASLNKILKEKEISEQLNIKVSQYFHQVWKYNEKNKDHNISHQLSQNLKKQLMNLSHLHIFSNIPLFERWQDKYNDEWLSFKAKIFDVVENQELADGEFINLKQHNQNQKLLYCILKGRIKINLKLAERERQILHNVNERFGFEEFFMQKPTNYTAQADSFTRLAKLSRSKFISCLKKFPTLYFEFVTQLQRMNFSQDRQLLGAKCWFCNQFHSSYKCPTNTRWRQTRIRKDPISLNQNKAFTVLDKAQSESKKMYRNLVRSEKVYKKRLAPTLQIDRIFRNVQLNGKYFDIYQDQRSKFNF